MSQYFSTITAPSMLKRANLVAGLAHFMQNLEFFSRLDINGSILFNVFSTNMTLSSYQFQDNHAHNDLPYLFIYSNDEAHWSQYLSNSVVAPWILYLTVLVAGALHFIQNFCPLS